MATPTGHRHPANVARFERATLGERVADLVAAGLGSWNFLIAQTVIVFGWIGWNLIDGKPFDPYPFILLNLAFSTQAAYSAPLLQLSQNRQGEHDRHRAEADYQQNNEALQLLRGIASGEIKVISARVIDQ